MSGIRARAGLTFVEILAAVLVLAGLAATAVPLLHHLVAGEEQLARRGRAVALLAELAPATIEDALELGPQELEGGYWLHAVALRAQEPPPAELLLMTREARQRIAPPRIELRCVRLRITVAPQAGALQLASTLRLLPPADAPEPQDDAAGPDPEEGE